MVYSMRVNDIESKPVTNWLAHQSTTNRFNTSGVNTVFVIAPTAGRIRGLSHVTHLDMCSLKVVLTMNEEVHRMPI